MTFKNLTTACLIGIMVPAMAVAQTKQDTTTVQLQQMVVIGTRGPQPTANLTQKIQIINRETIKKMGMTDVTDILKQAAGVDVVEYPGLLSGIGIRGFRPQNGSLNLKALVLIDGRPAASTNLAMIDVNNIERIEVLNGPASAIYGPQAMGGVVNIVTQHSSGKLAGNASLSAGSFGSWGANAAIGGKLSKSVDFDLNGGTDHQDRNFRLGKGNFFRNLLGQKTIENHFLKTGVTSKMDDTRGDGAERQHTTYDKQHVNGRIGIRIDENWKLNASGDVVWADHVNTPGDLSDGNKKPAIKDINRYSGDVTLEGRLSSNNNLTLKGFTGKESNTDYTTYEDQYLPDWSVNTVAITPYKSYVRNTKWNGFSIIDLVKAGNHSFTFGLENQSATFNSQLFDKSGTEGITYNPDYNQSNTGIFAQGNLLMLDKKLVISTGIRFDLMNYKILETKFFNNKERKADNQVLSPSLGLKYHVNNYLALRASIAKGYSPADIYSIAGYTEQAVWGVNKHVGIIQGNPDLKNMESVTSELGVILTNPGDRIRFEVTYFNTVYRNNALEKMTVPTSLTLTSKGDTIDSYTTYQNADKSLIQGLETSITGKLAGTDNYSLNAGLHWTHYFKAQEVAQEYGVGGIKRKMYNIANNSLRFELNFQNKKGLFAGLNARYVGGRYDRNWDYWDQLVETQYGDFVVMNANAGYRLKNHQLSLLINNLTDENYYEKRGFNLPGRSFSVKYTYSF